jgi:hypothetical protein
VGSAATSAGLEGGEAKSQGRGTIAAGMILLIHVTASATTDDYHRADIPSSGTYNTPTLILALDGIKFKIDELTDVADEGEDFPNAPIHRGNGSEDIDHSVRNRLSSLIKVIGMRLCMERSMDELKDNGVKRQAALLLVPTNLTAAIRKVMLWRMRRATHMSRPKCGRLGGRHLFQEKVNYNN